MQYPKKIPGKVEICGVSTATLPTLTDEEKTDLLRRSQAGDGMARERLTVGNLRLVLSIIQRFSGRRENMDDLFQVGCIGLLKAIDHFDLSLDVKFSTYAVPMIIGEVRRYLRDNNAIRVSRSMRDLAYRALQAREGLSLAGGRDPSVEEIALAIGEPVSAVSGALEAIVEPVSLFESVYQDGEDSVFVIDQLSDPEGSDDAWVETLSLRQAMEKLGEREKRIIRMRFYSGRTQTEVAHAIGISQAQVSRLEKAAVDKIRRAL